MKHKFKWLKFNNQKVRIDAEIASLISDLWKLDISTHNCCQAHCAPSCKHKFNNDGKILTKHCNNYVWITFTSTKDFEKFLNIVAVYEQDAEYNSMYSNIDLCCNGPRKSCPGDHWEAKAFMYNLGVTLKETRELIPEDCKKYYPKNQKTYGMFNEMGCKENNYAVLMSLFFPRKHLKYVEKKIKEALNQ